MDSILTSLQDEVLQRAPSVRLDLRSDGTVELSIAGKRTVGGRHTLAILDAFSRPLTLRAALDQLESRAVGGRDWIDIVKTTVSLYRAGALQASSEKEPIFETHGYAAPDIHVRMLNDRQRTSRFLAAIREVVRPGDVVLDIGTGTGILAATAAAAGARRVYAMEASRVAGVAASLFEKNGFGDRVTLLRGWSTELKLPERADVLVSEMIGNDPLDERVLEVTADAVKRLLKPGARLIPSRVRIFGLPVAVPQHRMTELALTPATARKWSRWYELDFSTVAAAARESSIRFSVSPQVARLWKTFSDPVLLADIDLASNNTLIFDNFVTAVASVAGKLTGILVYFDLQLGPTVNLSIAPAIADRRNHWRSNVWVLPRPLSLRAGEPFTVHYRHGDTDAGVSVTSGGDSEAGAQR